eukprot:m.90878 g.90878  ORF g.90878 m.90878 type:complete len:119 (+) comp14607_c2_seq1:177-533(+)
MPLVELYTNVERPGDAQALINDMCALAVKMTGKPIEYMMVKVNFGELMAFGGNDAPTAFIKLSSIGKITTEENKKYAAEFTKFVGDRLGVSAERIYLNFFDVAAANWGYNGSTFDGLL